VLAGTSATVLDGSTSGAGVSASAVGAEKLVTSCRGDPPGPNETDERLRCPGSVHKSRLFNPP